MIHPRQISVAFQTDKTAPEYIGLAKLVNDYAFDQVSVYCDIPYQPAYGPLLLMAPHIRRARLAPAGIPPARIHPIDIAANTALLDTLAPGRVGLGLVRGAWLKAIGIEESTQPIQQMREAIDVVRRLLKGETGGYAGKVYQIAPHIRALYPLPNRDIPLMIGTWGATLAALAGEVADELKIGGSANPDFIPIMQHRIAVGEERAGRKIGSTGVVIGSVTVVDEDREAARALARHEVALYLPIVASLDPTVKVEPDLLKRIQIAQQEGNGDQAAGLIGDELLDRFAFAGSPDDLIQQAEAIFEAGASRIEFGTPHGIDSARGLHLLGKHVLPGIKR